MKRLTYFYLIAVFVAANALLFVGCGCDDDDDDDTTDDGGTGNKDSGATETKDTGTSETKDTGTSETKDSGNGQSEDTGVSGGDATVDTGPEPVVYACGGDEAECDLLDEQSCDEGEGCQFLAPASGGAPFAQCVDVGEGEVGDACDDDNLCSAGSECHDGLCHKYCCTSVSPDDTSDSPNECPTDQACIINLQDENGESTGVSLCDDCDECNPLTSDGCSGDQGCYPFNKKGCRICSENFEYKVGEECEFVNDCLPGIGCYDLTPDDDEEVSICMAFCDLTADEDPCGDDSTCTEIVDLTGESSLDKDIGLCTPNE